jgi:hypothetical protein
MGAKTMKTRNLGYALTMGGVVALLGGCGGSQLPIAAPSTAQGNAMLAHAENDRAWMAPRAKGRDLLYASLGTVNVYAYPRGGLLGSLGVSGASLCSDKFGNVFIPNDGNGEVYVYAHGETRPKTIVYYYYEIVGCAVDPSSEALALAGSFTGGLVVFPYNRRRGWRYGQIYRDPAMFDYVSCAYDSNGDLFVDGLTASHATFLLIELPKGSKTFTTISLNQGISAPGSLQWNNGYLSVEDPGKGVSGPVVIYRFAINGSSGTKISTTHLGGSYPGQFWIQGEKVIGSLFSGSVHSIGFWKFPAGGPSIKSIPSNNKSPVGVAVSLK